MKQSNRPQNKEHHPIDEALKPESNKNVGRFTSGFMMLSVGMAFAFSTVQVIIDPVLFVEDADPTVVTKLIIPPPKPKPKPKPIPSSKQIQKNTGGKYGKETKAEGKGDVKGVLKKNLLHILGTRNSTAASQASQLMNNTKLVSDIAKVLDNTSGFKKFGKNDIGNRKGVSNSEFNGQFIAGGDRGLKGTIGSIIGGGGTRIGTKGKGPTKYATMKTIDIGQGSAARSKKSIMKVVRKRSPGLRHVYTKYLKAQSGFAGKVSLTFTISPGGQVLSIKINGSTTPSPSFDKEIRNKVKQWKFPVIKSGNTTITIPFTFSE